jgi:hypothetical protein
MSTIVATLESRAFTWTRRDLFFGSLQGVAMLCAALQCVIARDSENLSCVALTLIALSVLFQYLWRSDALVETPVSSLALLGMGVTTQFASLVAQTVEWVRFVELLRWPLTTFAVLCSVLLLAIAVHWIHRHLAMTQRFTQGMARHVMAPMGVLEMPRIEAIWIMAAFGLYALASAGVATGDSGGKALEALSFLAYVPFLIPIYYKQFGNTYCDIKKHGPVLMAYVLAMVVVSVAKNGRQLMAIGPVQAGLVYMMWAMQDPTAITRRTLQRLALLLVGLTVVLAVFADLSVAMVLNRDKVREIGPIEMIEETVRTFMDKPLIAQYKDAQRDDAAYGRYNEAYLSSPVLARFSETKFHDNNIYLATVLTDAEREELRKTSFDKLFTILPQPVLDAMGIDIDKDELAYSMGDYFRYLYEGPDNTLGGYATGSMWAHLIGLFGLPWLAPLATVIFVLVFLALDSFSRKGRGFDVAPVLICSAWATFLYALAGESAVGKVAYLLRDLPQKVLMYALLYWCIRQGLALFNIKSS